MKVNEILLKSHPGKLVNEWFMDEEVNIKKLGEKINIDPHLLLDLADCKINMSPQMAIALGPYYGENDKGGAYLLIAQQHAYDVNVLEQHFAPLDKFKPLFEENDNQGG